ncbi:MAG TPA: hypothetical protein VIV11_43480 [Kofleriaceae bacterium]
MRVLVAAGLLAGCYAPAPPAGAPCVDGMCPTGLVCSLATYTCETTGVDPDARVDDDARLDDAATDAPGDGSTSPYQYRRRITIQNNSSSALAVGFTIRVPLGATLATLINDGKVKADLSDLRVIGEGSLGERNRIVDPAGPTPAAINFSLAQSIAGNTTSTSYYVYYGRPSASAAPANGNQVFAVYDDFATAISSIWLKNDAPVVSNGRLLLRPNRTDAITTVAASDGVPIVSAVELLASISNPLSDPTTHPEGTFYYWFGYQHTGDFSASAPWVVWIARGKTQVHAEQMSPVGCEVNCEGAYLAQNTALHYYAIERDPSATRFYFDGALSYTATVTNNADYSLMVRNYQATGDVQVDWIRARIRVTPDPTITIGAEETL